MNGSADYNPLPSTQGIQQRGVEEKQEPLECSICQKRKLPWRKLLMRQNCVEHALLTASM